MSSPGEIAAPLVWLLTGDKGGDNAQMRALARAAGLQPVEIPLDFNHERPISTLRMGASTRNLTPQSRGRLLPPWPDAVISSGGRSVPTARWIRRQSGGRTRLIHVGRPWGRLAWFDLVLGMPQYALPDRPNVFHARMPFNTPDPAALAAAAQRWRARFEAYPRPWIGLLVGGKSSPLQLDPATAAGIGRAVSARAQSLGGSVLALTSRRTGAAAADALFDAIAAPALRYAWTSGDPDNPYLAVLALADELVVTGDSASMLAEAVRMRRPLSIAPLPSRPGHRRGRVAMAKRILPRAMFDLLVDLGIFTSIRDMNLLQRKLTSDGLASLLPDPPALPRAEFSDDLAEAAALVRAVIAGAAPKHPG